MSKMMNSEIEKNVLLKVSNIYADTHVSIKYSDFSNYFCHFETIKLKKMIISKNPNSGICPNMGGGQGSGPSHPDGVGPLGVIR